VISPSILEGVGLFPYEITPHVHLELNELTLGHLGLRLVLNATNLRKPILFLLIIELLHLKQLFLFHLLPQVFPWNLLNLVRIDIEIFNIVILPTTSFRISFLGV
jgi:hypothetical protein